MIDDRWPLFEERGGETVAHYSAMAMYTYCCKERIAEYQRRLVFTNDTPEKIQDAVNIKPVKNNSAFLCAGPANHAERLICLDFLVLLRQGKRTKKQLEKDAETSSA